MVRERMRRMVHARTLGVADADCMLYFTFFDVVCRVAMKPWEVGLLSYRLQTRGYLDVDFGRF
jgi:hypothetical protein